MGADLTDLTINLWYFFIWIQAITFKMVEPLGCLEGAKLPGDIRSFCFELVTATIVAALFYFSKLASLCQWR